MDTYSSSQFSHIGCVPLLLILFSMTFHDILFLLSGMFYLVPPYSLAYSADLFWSIYLYLFCTLDLHNTRVASLLSQVTCSKASPTFALSPPCRTRACQALDYLYKSTSYFEGLFAPLPLLTSISLHPTWKDSLLSFLDHLWCSRNTGQTECAIMLVVCVHNVLRLHRQMRLAWIQETKCMRLLLLCGCIAVTYSNRN